MDTNLQPRSIKNGFTLLELSVVILVLLTLLGAGLGTTDAYRKWGLAREASEKLRSVYVAQRTYLADNPTRSVEDLTPGLLIPYIPNSTGAMPTTKSLTGSTLNVRVNESPPYWTATNGGVAGARYDPSGTTTDSLWDVGE